jgi:hypothetical protein
MGNMTNPQQWAAQERLRFIEKSAFWRGLINRQDLMETYALSAAQATSDLQKFQELNPGALIYNLKKKRYEGAPTMKCRLHEPQLEEAMGLFLRGCELPDRRFLSRQGMVSSDHVAVLDLPYRQSSPLVQRAVFLSILNQLRVRIEYGTMSNDQTRWRWIVPHAFGHDGYRWHVRALCEESMLFKDFVLGRIIKTEWPTEFSRLPLRDTKWENWITITICPASDLGEDRRKSIAADYGMQGGELVLRTREAMLDYTLAQLRIPTPRNKMPPFLQLVKIDGLLTSA